MAGKHAWDTATTGRRTGRRWRVPALLTAAAVVGTSLTFGAVTSTADAAPAPTSAQLSLTGVSSARYPTGGNIVWVQPGGSVKFSAAPVSIAANQGPVLGLLGSLLGGLTGLEASADLGSVGLGNRTLSTSPTNTVTTGALQQGVYPITWSMTKILKGLLGGTSRSGVNLNGNQAKALGIALNASNQYVGYVYVSSTPPPGGLSFQLPTISVAPSLPVVGQLPTVTVPGTTVTIPTPGVPGVNEPLPGQSSSSTPSTGTTAPGTPAPTSSSSSSGGLGIDYSAPDCTGACAVVPRGGGGGGTVGGASGVTLGDLGSNGRVEGGSNAASGSDSSANAIAAGGNAANGGSDQLAVDRAFADRTSGIGGTSLPTSLTIAAIAALAGASVLWFARRRLARG